MKACLLIHKEAQKTKETKSRWGAQIIPCWATPMLITFFLLRRSGAPEWSCFPIANTPLSQIS